MKEFCEEENHLRWSLGVFFFTYFLRAALCTTIWIGQDIWDRMWTEYCILTVFLYSGSQLIYDIWPILLIMRHHHKTFKKEERDETTLILDRFSSTSLINQNRDSNESMKALQSQYFNTVERMRARTV